VSHPWRIPARPGSIHTVVRPLLASHASACCTVAMVQHVPTSRMGWYVLNNLVQVEDCCFHYRTSSSNGGAARPESTAVGAEFRRNLVRGCRSSNGNGGAFYRTFHDCFVI